MSKGNSRENIINTIKKTKDKRKIFLRLTLMKKKEMKQTKKEKNKSIEL